MCGIRCPKCGSKDVIRYESIYEWDSTGLSLRDNEDRLFGIECVKCEDRSVQDNHVYLLTNQMRIFVYRNYSWHLTDLSFNPSDIKFDINFRSELNSCLR